MKAMVRFDRKRFRDLLELMKLQDQNVKGKILIQYVKEDVPTKFSKNQLRAFLDCVPETVTDENMKILMKNLKATFTKTKVGVMLAFKDDDGKILVGFSGWNPMRDTYNYELMIRAALGRAIKWRNRSQFSPFEFDYLDEAWLPTMPIKIGRKLAGFIQRAEKYFTKNQEKYGKAHLVEWAENFEYK
jgi:hypothetical protein